MHRRITLAPMILVLALCTLQSIAQDAYRAGQLYEDARQYYFAGDQNAAIIQLKNALQADNQHVPSLLFMGDLLLETRDAAGARLALQEALILGGDAERILPKLAEAMLTLGDYAGLLKEVPANQLRGSSARAEVLGYRALAHLALNDLESAEQAIANARGIDPDIWTAGLARVNLQLSMGDLDAALDSARSLTDTWPERSDAWTRLGLVHQARGEAEAALSAYDRALTLSEEPAEALLSRSGLLMDLGRDEAAAADLEAYADLLPLDPRALYLRGQLSDRSGDTASATGYFQKVLEVLNVLPAERVASDEQLMFIGGAVNARLGNFESSSQLLGDYHARNPEDLQATLMLASVLLEVGDSRRAISLLTESAPQPAEEPRVAAMLARAYLQDGRFTKAIALFEGLEGSSVPGSEAHFQLARARLEVGQTRQGLEALLASYAANPEDLEVGFLIGTTYLDTRQYSAAVNIPKELLERAPRNPAFLKLLGEAELSRGERAAAKAAFESALGAQADYLPAAIGLAKVAAAAGDYTEGRRQLEAVLEQDAENVTAMTELARMALASEDQRAAVNWAETAVRQDPTSVAARLALIDVQAASRDLSAAEKSARQALVALEDNLDILAALARVHLAAGERERAVHIYRTMRKVVGFNADRLHRIASLQMDLQEWSEARATLYQSLTANPEHLPSSLAYTNVLLRLGQLDQALENSAQTLAFAPQSADALGTRAAVLLFAGRYGEADELYREALSLKHDARWVLGRYQLLLAQEQSDAASALLREAVASHPGDAVLRETLIDHLMAREEWAAARHELEVVLQSRPGRVQNLRNMAYTLNELGRVDEAQRFARQAHETSPNDALVNHTLGWILSSAGDWSDGLAYLREAAARAAGNPEIRYHLAYSLYRMGRVTEARIELSRALDEKRDFRQREAAEVLMGKLSGQE